MKLLLIAMLAAAAAVAQTVEVTVVDIDKGTPIAGVEVELVQPESAIRQGYTDALGVLRIEVAKVGDYTLRLTKPGFRQVRLHVGAGGNPMRVEERMRQMGQLTGKVTGGGKPIAGADLQLVLAGNYIGQVERSDAKGEFSFRGVDPGTYILSARATRNSPAAPEQDGRKMGFVRTWYPSVSDASGAAKIVVSPGSDLFGQDIELRAVPLYRVSGRVLSLNGEPAAGVEVRAAPPEEFAVKEFELSVRSKEDGAFAFEGLPDGNWRIESSARAETLDLYAARNETVAGRDLERVDLRFLQPFALTGKILRPDTGAPSQKRPLAVMLASLEGVSRASQPRFEPDGTFRFDSVIPGVYRFQPNPLGAPYYLASIDMNGRDVTGKWVEILPGTLPITITYRADGGTVRGTVEDCDDAAVVLAPREPDLQYGEFIRQTKCQQNGRFEITGVRPGEYYAFAFDKPVGVLDFSTFVNRSINQALRITVRAGEATDASLKVTQREIY